MKSRFYPVVKLAAATLSFGLLASCGTINHSMHASFDRLTNDSLTKSTTLLSYHSFLSVSGLAPQHVLGTLEHAPGSLSPSHAIGISPKWSYIVQSDFDLPTPSDQRMSASAASVKELYLSANIYAAEENALQEELQIGITAINAAKQRKQAGEKEGLLNQVASALSIQCSAPSCSETDFGTWQQEKENKLKQVRENLTGTNKKIAETLSRSNIIVTRWNANNTIGGNIEASLVASADAGSQKAQSGIAIFSGLRTLKVFVGEDFGDMLQNIIKNPVKRSLFSKAGITTFAILAKEVEYISDQDLQVNGGISATASAAQLTQIAKMAQITELADIFGKSTQVTANGGFRGAAILANSGKLSTPNITVWDYAFFPHAAHEEFLKAAHERNKGYTTVFAVRAMPSQILLAATGLGLSADADKQDSEKIQPNTSTYDEAVVNRCTAALIALKPEPRDSTFRTRAGTVCRPASSVEPGERINTTKAALRN